MSSNPMFSRSREPQQPLVAVALCFVVGCVLGWRWEFNLLWLVGGVALAAVGYMLFRWSWVALFMVLLSGAVAMTLSSYGDEEMADEGVYALRVLSPRQVEVEGFREGDGRWRGSSRVLSYGCDSTLLLRAGDRVVVEGRVKRFGERGYIYIPHSRVLEHEEDALLGVRINEAMSSRVDGMGLNRESSALVKAMLLGQRGGIDRGMLRSYRRSGAAHLLALSGLHIAIVAMILIALLSPLNFIYHGHIARSVAVIVLVWCYAYVVGMSASVVRASIMFSAFMLSPLTMRSYNSINILAFCVLVMTLFNPMILFDVGFQLSVVAVAAILLWAMPLWAMRGAVLRRWWSKVLLLPLLIGVVCSIATMPIISHTFGYISFSGVMLNPLLLITTYLILTLSMVWIVVGFGLVAPLFSLVIEFCVWLQSGVVEWSSAGWRDAVELRLDGLSLLLIYVGYVVLTLEFSRFVERRKWRRSIK